MTGVSECRTRSRMEDRGTSCTKGLTVGEKNVAALREVVVFYPCGGGSNVGLMTTEAVRILVKEKRGKMACLAGVGVMFRP